VWGKTERELGSGNLLGDFSQKGVGRELSRPKKKTKDAVDLLDKTKKRRERELRSGGGVRFVERSGIKITKCIRPSHIAGGTSKEKRKCCLIFVGNGAQSLWRDQFRGSRMCTQRAETGSWRFCFHEISPPDAPRRKGPPESTAGTTGSVWQERATDPYYNGLTQREDAGAIKPPSEDPWVYKRVKKNRCRVAKRGVEKKRGLRNRSALTSKREKIQ